jgi:hypothetical protein
VDEICNSTLGSHDPDKRHRELSTKLVYPVIYLGTEFPKPV